MRALLRRPGNLAAAHNVGWLIVERVARLVLSVLVGFAVARYLGPEGFGKLSYALALVAIAAAVAEGGVAPIIRREVAAGSERSAALLRAAAGMRLAGGVVCYAALLAWAQWGEGDATARHLLVVLGLMLFQPALSVSDLWLQARLQARLTTRAQLTALALGAALRLGLVFGRAPLIAFAIAPLIEAAVAIALLNHFARADGWPRQTTGAIDLMGLWRESWPLLVSGLTVMIYIRIDLVMVRQMAGEAAAGAYAAAVRLSEIWFFLPAAIVASALPSLLRARKEGPDSYRLALQRTMDLNAGIAFALTVPLVLLAPLIVRVAYGAAFGLAGQILVVHAWTLVWVALGVVRGQFCVNEGLTRLHLIATTAGAVLNVILNAMLIPRLGAVGAAWATLASQATAAWLSSFWFASTRGCAALQTRALLIPLRWIQYARPHS